MTGELCSNSFGGDVTEGWCWEIDREEELWYVDENDVCLYRLIEVFISVCLSLCAFWQTTVSLFKLSRTPLLPSSSRFKWSYLMICTHRSNGRYDISSFSADFICSIFHVTTTYHTTQLSFFYLRPFNGLPFNTHIHAYVHTGMWSTWKISASLSSSLWFDLSPTSRSRSIENSPKQSHWKIVSAAVIVAALLCSSMVYPCLV